MVKKQNYMDTDIFIVYTKTKDAETRFDTSNYELGRLLPKRKNKQVIGFMKEELGWKTMTKLRAKTYSYLIGDSSKDKNAKGTKRCVIKSKLKLENYKNCLEVTQLENKKNYLQK